MVGSIQFAGRGRQCVRGTRPALRRGSTRQVTAPGRRTIVAVRRDYAQNDSAPPWSRGFGLAFLVVFLAGLAILVARRPWQRPLDVDWAYRELEGQAIRRGEVPYRDFFLHKGPLGGYVAALGQAGAVRAGGDFLLGSRALDMLMAAGAAAFLAWAWANAIRSRAAGAFGGLVLLAFHYYGAAATSGVEPKIAMACGAFAALVAFQGGRPLLAGALAAVATLFWQMGALVLLVLLVELAWQRRPARDWARLGIGFGLPMGAMAAYLGSQGALRTAWQDAVLFNLPYAELYARGPFGAVGFALSIWRRTYACDLDLVALGLVGLAAFPWRARWADGRPVLLLGGLSLVLLLVNMQDSSDTLFLLPYIAAFAGLGLWRLARRLWSLSVAKGERIGFLTWPRACGLVALLLVAHAVAKGLTEYWPTTLADQRRAMARAETHMGPGPVYAVAAPEALVLTGRRSVSKYWYLYNGVAQWIEAHEAGGLLREMARVETERPAVVLIDRTAFWDEAYAPFCRWLFAHYRLQARYYQRYYYHPSGRGVIVSLLRPVAERRGRPWLPPVRREAQVQLWKRSPDR